MSTVIYLANQQIRAVTGKAGQNKIAVSKCYVGDAPEGSIINGIIMDQESFVGFMKQFFQTNGLDTKDVTLVVNSSKFVGKTIEMPCMNDKKTLDFIEREFADIRRDETFIYGYKQIQNDKKINKIYVEGIFPDFIKDYVDIFAEIGVKVKAIYSGESSLIRLTDMTLGKRYRTFILQIAEKMTITTLLWVNGSFYYFNSARCFHEQGTEDYAMDVARSVSQVRQFMQAHQIEYPLEAVVLAGIVPQHLPMYQGAIMQQGIQSPIVIFESSAISSAALDIQFHLHAASGLVVDGNGKHQNFLLSLQRGRTEKKKNNGSLKWFFIIAATLAVMLIILAAAIFSRNTVKRKLKKAKEFNEDPVVLMDVARYKVLTERNNFLMSQYDAINKIESNLYTYPACNSKVTKIIDDCAAEYATISYESFYADKGVVEFTATSDTVDNINLFIKRLCEQNIFCNVDYTGYSYIESNDSWDIHVTVTLSESAGR